MTLETAMAIGSAALSIAGVIAGVLKIGRQIGQSETQIKADISGVKAEVQVVGERATKEIASLRTQSTADLSNLAIAQTSAMNRMEANTAATIANTERIAEMRHREVTNRVDRVEGVINSITKVVVFTKDARE